MQKKLVALMLAGGVSVPALAQSNVQIYGILDLGLARHGGSEIIGGLGATDRSRTAIDSANQAPAASDFAAARIWGAAARPSSRSSRG